MKVMIFVTPMLALFAGAIVCVTAGFAMDASIAESGQGGMTKGNPPYRRGDHTAVWTGSEMIVWGGGCKCEGYLNSGGSYDPATNRWADMTTNGAPAARHLHAVVWTGREMIVWGGFGAPSDGGGQGSRSSRSTGLRFHRNPELNDGGCYNPQNNSWQPVTTNGAPVARYSHTTVWAAPR